MDAKKAAQNGTTLLEAMVAVALLGIAGGILFKSISSFLLSGKAIQSANAYQNVESFVQGVLTTQLRTYMTNPSPCAKPFGINVADVGYTISMWPGATVLMAPPSAPFTAAVTRCGASPRLALNSGNPNAYFCLRFTPTGTTRFDSGSFVGAKAAFAEVYVQPVNIQTGSAVACTVFAQAAALQGAGSVTTRVFYTLDWIVNGGPQGDVLHQRNGFFYLPPN